MPKRRNGSSIANRQDLPPEGGLDENEMSRRLEDRLAEIGTIDVDIPSRTRHRMERVHVTFGSSSGEAAVQTPGGHYLVNHEEETCTCPDHRYRGGWCRHLEAVGIAREEVRRGILPGSLDDADVAGSQVMTAQSNVDIQDQQAIPRHYIDDDFFYSENQDVFAADFAAARQASVPYRYHNVLNGSDVTLGIELEFVGGDSDGIARELYDLGICGSPRMESYHSSRSPGKWVLERDGSVTNGRQGGELVSPILTDTPETWQQIEKVCEVAKRHGARVNQKTGGHIHIGAETILDGKRQRWRRFFKMGAGFEQVFTRLSGGEQGRFRGGHYAESSLSQSLQGIRIRMPEVGDTAAYQSIIGRISQGKYQRINIRTFAERKKTVEFRGFNGTLTPGIIQANVMYAAGVVNSAERSRIKGSEADNIIPTASDRKRGRIINDYMSNNAQTDAAIMATLDAVFSRREDKQHILSVIAKNSWE